MISSCVSSCTQPRSVRRQLPFSFPLGPSRPPMRPILRHGDRKPVAVTTLDSAFTKRHTRNSFRMRIYENCRGVPSFFLFRNAVATPTLVARFRVAVVSMPRVRRFRSFPQRQTVNCKRSTALVHFFRDVSSAVSCELSAVGFFGMVRGDSSVSLQLSTVNCQLPTRVSSLECAVPRFRTLSPLECADPKTPPYNPFRMRSSEKRWGGGGPLIGTLLSRNGVTLFALSLFSITYELPNLQLLCFDNDPTVPGVVGVFTEISSRGPSEGACVYSRQAARVSVSVVSVGRRHCEQGAG